METNSHPTRASGLHFDPSGWSRHALVPGSEQSSEGSAKPYIFNCFSNPTPSVTVSARR